MNRLIICIDGLGKDLINKEDTPFLYRYGKENSLMTLKTFFAFTEEYSFFSGESPREHNKWLEFKKSEDSIFNHFLISLFSFNNKLRNNVAGLVQYFKGRRWVIGTHQIPQDQLINFDSSLKEGLWELPFFKGKGFVIYKWPLFAVRNRKRSDIRLVLNYEDDERRLGRLLSVDTDIYCIQIMKMDKTMHKHGKNSNNTKFALKETDKLLEKTVDKFLKEHPEGQVVLWSDHGFADIDEVINLEEYLPEERSFVHFIAGTTAHFWVDELERAKILDKIGKDSRIKVLTKELADKYKIPFNEDYGNLVLFVEKGGYFFPNFYQKTESQKYKGMHGYPDDSEMNGFLLVNKKVDKKIIDMEGALEVIQENFSSKNVSGSYKSGDYIRK